MVAMPMGLPARVAALGAALAVTAGVEPDEGWLAQPRDDAARTAAAEGRLRGYGIGMPSSRGRGARGTAGAPDEKKRRKRGRARNSRLARVDEHVGPEDAGLDGADRPLPVVTPPSRRRTA